MRENIILAKARKIQTSADGYEREGRFSEGGAMLAFEHLIELGLEFVEMEDIRGGVCELALGQSFGTPVGALLLLGEFDPQ